MRRASVVFSGGSARARSLKTSTMRPPAPNSSTGPNCGSMLLPRISSNPVQRDHRLHRDAEEVAFAGAISHRRFDRLERARTACASERFNCTPPTFDLCVIGLRVQLQHHRIAEFVARTSTASSAVLAVRVSTIGMPYAASNCFDSVSVSNVRPASRADLSSRSAFAAGSDACLRVWAQHAEFRTARAGCSCTATCR